MALLSYSFRKTGLSVVCWLGSAFIGLVLFNSSCGYDLDHVESRVPARAEEFKAGVQHIMVIMKL